MSRANRSTRVNLGMLSFAPKRRKARAKPSRVKVQAPAVENGGYPDTATWAVAAMLDVAHVRTLAGNVRSEAACYPTADREALATTLLAIQLAQHARLLMPGGLLLLAEHLIEVGIGGIDWDAIARKALA